MRRLCALGVLVWSAAATVHAAPPDGTPLPSLVEEPAEPAKPAELTEPEPAGPAEPAELAETEPAEPEPTEPEPAEPEQPPTTPEDDLATAPVDPTEPPPPPPSAPPPLATPTSSRAPTSPPPSPPPTSAKTTTKPPSKREAKREAKAKDEPEPEAKDETEDDEEKPEKIKHKGFIIDFRAGLIGCTRLLCKRHDAKPGLRLDGMLGRNFFGFIDLGLAGAWGRMRANVAPGTDGLSLYGLTPDGLPPEAALLMFDQFTVNDAHLDTVQAGLNARVHVIPRGRFDPYVGVGAQYNLFRAVYDTPAGSTRMGFHGLAFPLQAGFVVFATKRLAFGAQFDYLVTWYGGITIRGAPGDLGAPIPLIKDAAAEAGVNLPGDLPQMWTAGGVVHIRLGK